MFEKTSNPYRFKYLITGISGPGIEQVYLPEVPPDDQILFKKEQRFVRPEIPDHLKKAMAEYLAGRDVDPDYVHPLQSEINAWEDQEWDRTENGIWFWNKGVPTYITGFHYFHITAWRPYFGYPTYRETDKEIAYWIQYFEEDPDCFGGALNTCRRYGKSVLMGSWATYRTVRSYNHFSGMQGETDQKIKKFYNKFIRKPFYKLPYYFQPKYNDQTKQTESIEFDLPPKRRERRNSINQVETLESIIEYRPSGEGEYDGDILNTYLMEEPGKTKRVSIYNDDGEGRWDIVQSCLLDGMDIIGKALMGTTVEYLNTRDKGGRAYQELFYDSDYNDRQADGRTRSGLYVAFLPGDCALKGYWDHHGFPKRDEARERILKRRLSFKNNPNKLAGLIRRYPLSVPEIFYVNPAGCEFNVTILQDTINSIDAATKPLYSRFDLSWKDNKRFTEVVARHNPDNGWLKAAWMFTDNNQANAVASMTLNGEKHYAPKNDIRFAIGCDPIDHGFVSEGVSKTSDDEATRSRRSKPVVLVKRKMDSAIDGAIDQEEYERRAKPGKMVQGKWVLDDSGQKYQYQTNKYVAMMDIRPNDPKVFYERTLMICWYFGASIHVEQQKPGLINHLKDNNCEMFLFQKYIPVDSGKKRNPYDDGTPASAPLIQEYTAEIASYVEYFGHTVPFRELLQDMLLFNAAKPREHDYTVAMGFTEIACKMKPKNAAPPILDLNQFFPSYNPYTGEPIYVGGN